MFHGVQAEKLYLCLHTETPEKQRLLALKFTVHVSPSQGFSARFEAERCVCFCCKAIRQYKFGDILPNLS